MNRRELLRSAWWLAASSAVRGVWADSAVGRPRILLRSAWQVVNIGDIAHTPGVLALLEKYLPEAEVVLWASSDLSPEVAALEQQRFPRLKIVKGTLDAQGRASNQALAEAVEWATFLLHGSGPALVAAKDVAAFRRHTGKPFGVYAITHGSFLSGDDRELLSQAKFVYFRDSVSLARAWMEGVRCPMMGWAPDGAFACDVQNDPQAERFLRDHGLMERQFLCCLSRLRYTPYWSLPGSKRPLDPQRQTRNEEMKEQDHRPLREAIIRVARETPLRVLLCPEDMTQMAVGKELLYDPLPADVRARVVWRDRFWLTDEARSVYLRSAGLFGSEMHSPILAVGSGIPALVARFAEQTSKGFMWRDIGLGDWLFDLDQLADRERLPAAVLALAQDGDLARAKAEQARVFVQQRQRETMEAVREVVMA
ncbi:MAG: polysaccharide pyruvyl transferase family protein [Pirellulales bacterium]